MRIEIPVKNEKMRQTYYGALDYQTKTLPVWKYATNDLGLLYMDLKFFLEDNLGLSVDLVTKKMLKPQIINSVEKDIIYVS